MENKYYTPEYEDFHAGFEYEYNDYDMSGMPNWKKQIWDGQWNIPKRHYDKYSEDWRVKYLDREDVESLGFQEIGQADYYMNGIVDNIRIEKLFHKEIYSFYRVNYSRYDIGITCLFAEIKNKSELIKIMKQLKAI
jgi:hypothetical protein